MSEPTLDELLADEAVPEETEASTGETSEPPSQTDSQQEAESETEAEAPAEVEEKPEADESSNRVDPEQFKGYLDEREKRQKLEREVEELRKQMQGTQQAEKPVDPVDDPEGFQAQVQQAIKQATFQQDLKWMRRTHDDWEEAEAWINEQLGQNVALQAKLQNSESILDDAYAMFQQHKKLEALEDVDAMEARLRAEIEAKVRAELEAGKQQDTEKTQQVEKAVTKPSTVSTGTSQSTAYRGEQTLEDIMGSDFAHRPK